MAVESSNANVGGLPPPAPPGAAGARPAEMEMAIQGGMLKTLGINLYTSLGKVLVEFIANAYDSDATKIEIQLPVDQIALERKKLRTELKARLAQPSNVKLLFSEAASKFDLLKQTLPESVQVVLKDDGHGMSWADVRERFLPVNKLRRADVQGRETIMLSESGKRHVMGRKGVGKLAGFGAAERVDVWTKRKNETYATQISMDDRKLRESGDISKIPIPARYDDNLDPGLHGTTITLSVLKSDALKEGFDTIKEAVIRSFYMIRPEDFSIYINGQLIVAPAPEYEFIYPSSLKVGEFADETAAIEELGDIAFSYFIGFRKRQEHLKASQRGARIYCNNRLAAGPTLLGLGTGMHSFHSTDYIECVVQADELDRGPVDLINTSRTQLKEGNEFSEGLGNKVTELMKSAIAAHAKFREGKAQQDIENDPNAKVLQRIVSVLPRKTRAAAQKLLTSIAAEHGVGTPTFDELAPIIINSVNATDVLIKLIELGGRPETLERVARELRELGDIEKVDALKLYRGRRSGIQALLALEQKGEENWGRKQIEKELHDLLKQCTWLIRPEFSTFLTSDQQLNSVVSKIARHVGVDKFAPVSDDVKNDETRPDLVFLMSDPSMEGPFIVNVIELKSPSLPLNQNHWTQLEEYLFKIRQWCRTELQHDVTVHGYLIGAMPDRTTKNTQQLMLLEKFKTSTPSEPIRIIGLTQLINDAMKVHMEAIKTLEQELQEDEVPSAEVMSGSDGIK
ncbi:MAG: ATP-binding protein [Rhizobiales bacterium]|nr:ATP-binding protein [Hyphomicrobiales bacterium]